MNWYEIVALSFLIGSIVAAVVYGLLYDVRRIREQIRTIRKQGQFYDIAGEWFANQLSDKP